jgi:hemoglobin/transferrin/lactoferrin receptor protein
MFKPKNRIMVLCSVFFILLVAFRVGRAEEAVSAKTDSSDIPTYFLKGMVITANRYEQQPFKVPQAVSILSSEKIQKQSPAIIPDLFRNIPGVETNDAGPFRTRPVIRGMLGSRILILVDGERLNNTRESTFSGAQLSLVDIGQVERVEVVYGPGSVLYGSDALGGVVNIITKNPEGNPRKGGLRLNGNLSLRYSTVDEQRKGRLEVGGRHKKFSFLAGGSIRKVSDYESPETTVVNSALGKEKSFDVRASYDLSDKHGLSLDYQRFRADDVGYPGTPDPPKFPAKFSFPYHDRDKIALKWEAKNLSTHLPKISAKVFYQDLSKAFDSEMTISAGPTMSVYSFSRTLTDVEMYGFNFQELFLTSKDQHLTWGLDYYREIIDGSRDVNTKMLTSGGQVLSDTTTTNSTVPENTLDAIGIFLNNQLNILDRATLTLGIRYDRFDVKTKKTEDYLDTRVTPPIPFESKSQSLNSINGGLGIVYKLSERINLVGNLASAFRAPNVVEEYFCGQASGNEFVVPNYDLEPEKSFNLDVGVKFNFEEFFASLTLFQNNFRDYIELESTGDSIKLGHQSFPEWHYTNISELRIQGIEGTVESNLGKGIYGSFNFAYNHGKNLTLDQPFFVSPLKTVVTLGWKEKKGRFGLESNLRYVDKQDRVPKDVEGKYRDNLPTPSFTVLGMEAFVELFGWQTLNIVVNNLTNETYSEPYNATNPDNPVVEPGRNFIISLTTRF